MTTMVARPATAMNSASDPRILGSVSMRGVAVAIWQRKPALEYQEWLDGLDAARFPRLRCRTTLAQLSAALNRACIEAGTPPSRNRECLVDDIADLARRATEVTKSQMVDLRMDVSGGQPCPKWHLDAVTARLICTLRGAGTQFGTTTVETSPADIQQMQTGDVGMFRGSLWPGDEVSGILHRSPPADNLRERFLLVIDPLDMAGSC